MATIRFNHEPAFTQEKSVDLLGQLLNHGTAVTYICMSGSCGMCKVKVVAGMEHLSPKAGMESMHACKDGERLACQAVCRGTGDVVVEQ
jgi:ferredoxin